MKKYLSSIIIITLVVISLMGTAVAVDRHQESYPAISYTEFSARAEQTEWKHRVYNGKLQKRLWSITYNKWLTDWMDA